MYKNQKFNVYHLILIYVEYDNINTRNIIRFSNLILIAFSQNNCYYNFTFLETR